MCETMMCLNCVEKRKSTDELCHSKNQTKKIIKKKTYSSMKQLSKQQ